MIMKKVYEYKKSHELFRKATEVIPGGIYGLQNPFTARLLPVDSYPFFAEKVKGVHLLDADGNDFIDYRCSIGEISLGYRDADVDEAVKIQLSKCDNTSLASTITVELASYIVSNVWSADWASFSKTPQEALRLAIKGAKSYTSRKKVVIFDGYRSINLKDSVITVPYGDIDALSAALTDEIAAVVLPLLLPTDGGILRGDSEYLRRVGRLTEERGSVLIVDEILSGMRTGLKGGDFAFKADTDIIVFGSSLSNGYSIGIVAGKEKFKTEFSELEYTENFFASATSVAATLATMKKMSSIDYDVAVEKKGTKLRSALEKASRLCGTELIFSGIPSIFAFRISDDPTFEKTSRLLSACAERGVLFSPYVNFVTAALEDYDIAATAEIFLAALKTLKN